MCDHFEPFPQFFQVFRFISCYFGVHRSDRFNKVYVFFDSYTFERFDLALLDWDWIWKFSESEMGLLLIVIFIHELANVWCFGKLCLIFSDILAVNLRNVMALFVRCLLLEDSFSGLSGWVQGFSSFVFFVINKFKLIDLDELNFGFEFDNSLIFRVQ